MRLLLLPVLFAIGAASPQDPTLLVRTLTFETEHPGGTPAGWIGQAGVTFADNQVVHGGRWSARIERRAGAAGEFSGILKTIPLDVGGQTIVLRGFLRTADVKGTVALWLREDGDRPGLAFDTTQGRQVSGTTDWQEHRVSVPVRPDGRQLAFGVLVIGTGTVWADDLELLDDDKPIAEAPKAVRPTTVLDTDTEFEGGSKIVLDRPSAAQIDNGTTLGKVWGFLKYHHPLVTSGARHWDYELFRILPSILAADRQAGNAVLVKWIAGLGPVKSCQPCAALKPDDLHLAPDLRWLEDEASLGPELKQILRTVYANRPAADRQFYVSLVPNVGNPSFDHEPAYAGVTLPDSGYQLLALYRFWNIVQYWYPNRAIVGEDWNGVLPDTVERIALSKTADDYKRQLLALIACASTTPTRISESCCGAAAGGACQLPVTVRFVEDRPVVVKGDAGLEPGDVLSVARQRCRDGARPGLDAVHYAASNDSTRLRDIARSMTRGPCTAVSVGLEREGRSMTIAATRVAGAADRRPDARSTRRHVPQLADGTVGYLKRPASRLPTCPRISRQRRRPGG